MIRLWVMLGDGAELVPKLVLSEEVTPRSYQIHVQLYLWHLGERPDPPWTDD